MYQSQAFKIFCIVSWKKSVIWFRKKLISILISLVPNQNLFFTKSFNRWFYPRYLLTHVTSTNTSFLQKKDTEKRNCQSPLLIYDLSKPVIRSFENKTEKSTFFSALSVLHTVSKKCKKNARIICQVKVWNQSLDFVKLISRNFSWKSFHGKNCTFFRI